MPIEGLFLLLASIQALIIVKRLRRNETAKIKTVRKKPLRPLMWLGRSCAIKLRKARCFVNEPPKGRQNQTKMRYMFTKPSAMKS